MATRARPGAAEYSKSAARVCPEPQNARRVPPVSAPEPQNARRVQLEPPRRRRMLDRCRASLPWSRSMLEKCRSKNAASCSSINYRQQLLLGSKNDQKGPLESAPEPQNARRVPLEPAPEPQDARRVALEPGAAACSKSAARAHSREVRSFFALEMAALKMLTPVLLLSASTFARLRFASCMLCTGSRYIYIYIYIYIFV